MSKEKCGKTSTKSYWLVEPKLVLPPDLLPFLGQGNMEKEKESIEWLDKYGLMLLEAQDLIFLGKLQKWAVTAEGEVRYLLTTAYPAPIYFNKVLNKLYPEDKADVEKKTNIKDKIFYLSPLLKHFGMIFVLDGTQVLLPKENLKNGDSNEY